LKCEQAGKNLPARILWQGLSGNLLSFNSVHSLKLKRPMVNGALHLAALYLTFIFSI
jgi:hypothetical protein